MASTILIVAVALVVLGITTEARSMPGEPGELGPSESCPTSQLQCVYPNCADSDKTTLYIKYDGRQCAGCDVCNLDTSGDVCPAYFCTFQALSCPAGQTFTTFNQYFQMGNEECGTCPALACV